MTVKKTKTISVPLRLPNDHIDAINEMAKIAGVTRNTFLNVVLAIEVYKLKSVLPKKK